MKNTSPNKTFIRLIITLILIICFLLTILVGVISIASSLWLHTYKTFTQKKYIAKITTSEKKYKSGIPYSRVTYKEVNEPSAFESIFSRQKGDEVIYEEAQEFQIYGDRFEISAEIIKWNDWANLLGLDTIYKVSRIKGDYSDTELEEKATHSVYDINGGVDNYWQFLQNNEQKLSFLVDSVYSSAALKFTEDREVTWGLYVTEDGLMLDRME